MKFSLFLEYLRAVGICITLFFGFLLVGNDGSRLNYFSLFIVIFLSGTTGIEGLFLGRKSSKKIGYSYNREYQIQSALSNIAVAIVAIISFTLDWGKYSSSAIISISLLFFFLSGINHACSAILHKNYKIVNLLRLPIIIILIIVILPTLINALYT